METHVKRFGIGLAFAAIENVNLVGEVTNEGKIIVHVSYREATGAVAGFTSIEQAEDAMTIAHRACLSELLVEDEYRADLAISILSMIATKSYIYPTQEEEN
jgi:hypothetical protein